MTPANASRGLVLGCGAQVGFAWSLGALAAVEQKWAGTPAARM